ncbi:hypothetical protein [Actinomadura madurae]|nr:hypothetical protein [Actinomadura madurae]MCP9978748.1 hypothetical protein [Actinomadura madurae]
MAIRPARRKNTNDVIRYMYPITLWSVVVSQDTSTEPRGRRSGAASGS